MYSLSSAFLATHDPQLKLELEQLILSTAIALTGSNAFAAQPDAASPSRVIRIIRCLFMVVAPLADIRLQSLPERERRGADGQARYEADRPVFEAAAPGAAGSAGWAAVKSRNDTDKVPRRFCCRSRLPPSVKV